jgi:hypothetical protein
MSYVLRGPLGGARLFAGDESVQGRDAQDGDQAHDTTGPREDHRFVVSLDALARSIVFARPMQLWSRAAGPVRLVPSLRIGDVALDAEAALSLDANEGP